MSFYCNTRPVSVGVELKAKIHVLTAPEQLFRYLVVTKKVKNLTAVHLYTLYSVLLL